jgi:hypothetical protein
VQSPGFEPQNCKKRTEEREERGELEERDKPVFWHIPER